MTNDCLNLDSFLDNQLAPGERSRFATHLDDCPTCREVVELDEWIDSLLRAPAIAQLEAPPRALVESCRTALARRRKRSWLIAGGLAAAAAMLVAIGWTVLLNRQAEGIGASEIANGERAGTDKDIAPALPSATFVGDSNFIAVPVESTSPDVTIVRVFPVYQPAQVADADTSTLTEPPQFDDPVWADTFNGG